MPGKADSFNTASNAEQLASRSRAWSDELRGFLIARLGPNQKQRFPQIRQVRSAAGSSQASSVTGPFEQLNMRIVSETVIQFMEALEIQHFLPFGRVSDSKPENTGGNSATLQDQIGGRDRSKTSHTKGQSLTKRVEITNMPETRPFVRMLSLSGLLHKSRIETNCSDANSHTHNELLNQPSVKECKVAKLDGKSFCRFLR